MTTTDAPQLPMSEEYSDAWKALADFNEFVLDELSRRVFKAINYEGEQEVTLEQIGALAVFAHDLRSRGQDFVELAEKLARVAVDDLALIQLEGHQGSVPRYDEHGFSNYVSDKKMHDLFASAGLISG